MSDEEEEENYMENLDCWADIAYDERMEKLLQARRFLSMARRLQAHFPDVAEMNREIAHQLWKVSKAIKTEYRK
jgi:hypothetical protein